MAIEDYIWFEKYRPKGINEMSLPVFHKQHFSKYIEDQQIPHLLLEGSAGSGKSSVGAILMNTIRCVKMVFNGSTIGIGVVRTVITDFSKSNAGNGKLKIILINEADKIKTDALGALHDIMETYSKNCRFILTCNHLDKIDKPIQSRCTVFRFSQFPKKRLLRLLQSILAKEGIQEGPEEELLLFIDKYYPDIRSIINNLQSSCLGGVFNPNAQYSLQVDTDKIEKLLLAGKLRSLREEIVKANNYQYIYRWLFDYILPKVDYSLQPKVAKEILDFSAIDNRVPDREIQMVGCLLSIMLILNIGWSFEG